MRCIIVKPQKSRPMWPWFHFQFSSIPQTIWFWGSGVFLSSLLALILSKNSSLADLVGHWKKISHWYENRIEAWFSMRQPSTKWQDDIFPLGKKIIWLIKKFCSYNIIINETQIPDLYLKIKWSLFLMITSKISIIMDESCLMA